MNVFSLTVQTYDISLILICARTQKSANVLLSVVQDLLSFTHELRMQPHQHISINIRNVTHCTGDSMQYHKLCFMWFAIYIRPDLNEQLQKPAPLGYIIILCRKCSLLCVLLHQNEKWEKEEKSATSLGIINYIRITETMDFKKNCLKSAMGESCDSFNKDKRVILQICPIFRIP